MTPSPSKTFTRKALVDGRDLHIIDRHTALLDQTARLTAGRALRRSRPTSKGTLMLPFSKSASVSVLVGMLALLPPAPKSALADLLRLLGLLFPVDECGELVGEDLPSRG